jgi:hypothetical protein
MTTTIALHTSAPNSFPDMRTSLSAYMRLCVRRLSLP